MKTICGQMLFTFSTFLLLSSTVQGDEPLPRTGALGSGANIGQAVLGQTGTSSLTSTTTAPLTQGLGQIVSGWTHQGIHGTELAERIHRLQATRFDQREDLREKMRNLREDQKESQFGRPGDDRNTAEKIGSLGGKPASNGEGLGNRFNSGQFEQRGPVGRFKVPGRGRR